ncbi:hypothetical protein L6164_021946 [Bauhinia variegata]|uniref:Uncharacterized protein n=1 Tax=Bauhinia variegata TaxID=167791 RepID=A0ACB9MGY4_BAUVA|nr:hypothetical protein L6164_021946 [Bauhinia variegata]
MVHLNRLNFSCQSRGTKGDNHTRLENTSLNTTNGDSSNTTNLVNVLKWKTKGLVSGPLWLIDLVQGFKEGGTLVPVKVGRSLNHVVALKPRDGNKRNLIRVVTHLLQIR